MHVFQIHIMTDTPPTPHPRTSRPQEGRSLIELMIALIIGSIVLIGVLFVSSGTSAGGRRVDALSRLTETGQVALQVLATDVRMAGFSNSLVDFTPGFPSRHYNLTGIRGCDTQFDNAVAAGAASEIKALTCPPGSDASTDSASLAVVYEVDQYNANSVTSTEAGLAQAFADCRGFGLLSDKKSQLTGNYQITPGDLSKEWYWRVENRYYVALDPNTGTNALMCTGNGAAPFSNGQALVRGVERMVLLYGIGSGAVDNDKADDILVMKEGVIQYMTAAQIDSDAVFSKDPPEARWQRVISVRICLEIAGDAGSADKISNGNYGSFTNCNGTIKTITDGVQRRAVTMTMNLRNRTAPASDSIGLFGV